MALKLSRAQKRWYETVYLRSTHWIERRNRYLRGVCYCEMCRLRHASEVHHASYENIGREPDEDLLALCGVCHGRLHKPRRHPEPANDNQLELPLEGASQK